MDCIFNSPDYLRGLSSIGEVISDRSKRFHLLRRSIPDTELFDGFAGVPYFWMNSTEDIHEFACSFPDLVTITLVTQPGFKPIDSRHPSQLLKNHFVFDPMLPRPQLSTRSKKKLLKSEAFGEFSIVKDYQTKMNIIPLYRKLQESRQMYSPFENHSDLHFKHLAQVPKGIFFQAASPDEIGSMACGVRFGDWLQLLHTVNGPEGLQWNSSYLLMNGILDYCQNQGLKLSTGGVPQRHTPGLEIFKSRWSNCQLPVYLTQIINRPEKYNMLCQEFLPDFDYFPLYRSPR